jgi:hypothetical protein
VSIGHSIEERWDQVERGESVKLFQCSREFEKSSNRSTEKVEAPSANPAFIECAKITCGNTFQFYPQVLE